MKLLRATRKSRVVETEDMIVFSVHGIRFAIAAAAVDEIRNLDGLMPYSAAGRNSKARYTLTREAKGRQDASSTKLDRGGSSTQSPGVYFVVDAAAHFHLQLSRPSRVLLLRDCATAVLVGYIARMLQVSKVIDLPLAFSGEERSWYRGLTVVDDQVIPVVNPEAFLSKAEVSLLQASFKASAATTAKAKGAASA